MVQRYKEDVEWFMRQVEQDKSNEARYPDYKERFPYEVVLVDQFQGHGEYGYDTVSRYSSLEEAIASARKITEEALLISGSVESWHGMGDAGLVYDSSGALVWDGVREYTSKEGGEEIFSTIEFTAKAHFGHYRKGTKVPYLVHPLGVAKILIENECTNKIVIAGILHDIIEDAKVPYAKIKESFGYYIAELVNNVTEPDQSLPWKKRKQDKLEHLGGAGDDVLLVACADKIDNLRAIHYDYIREGESLWNRFNSPKEDQEWYYKSLVDLFASRFKSGKGKLLYESLVKELQAVFGG